MSGAFKGRVRYPTFPYIPCRLSGPPESAWSTGTAQELISRRDGPFGPAAYGYPARLAPYQKVSSIMTRDLEGHAPGGKPRT